MTDRCQSWAESYAKAAAMREQTLDRILKPKSPTPPDLNKPQVGGIPYHPTSNTKA